MAVNSAKSIALLLSLAFITSSAWCQDEASDEKKIYREYTKAELEAESSDLNHFLNHVLYVSINTNEESVESFVEILQQQSPIHLNIIVMEDAKEIQIPPIRLSNVCAGAVINSVSVASNELVTFEYDESGQIGFVGRAKGYVPGNRVSVLNLAHVLNSYTNESFLSAVEIGMEMMGSKNSSIQMKLHDETNTLFLRGSDEEIHLIEQVVDQLSQRQNQMQMLMGGRGNRAGGLSGGGVGGLIQGNGFGVGGQGGPDTNAGPRGGGRGGVGGGRSGFGAGGGFGSDSNRGGGAGGRQGGRGGSGGSGGSNQSNPPRSGGGSSK